MLPSMVFSGDKWGTCTTRKNSECGMYSPGKMTFTSDTNIYVQLCSLDGARWCHISKEIYIQERSDHTHYMKFGAEDG